MATTTDEYFSSGLNVTNGQVIKTEGTIPTTTQYFNGNGNQFNSNQQQTFTFDNIVYNTTSKIFSRKSFGLFCGDLFSCT